MSAALILLTLGTITVDDPVAKVRGASLRTKHEFKGLWSGTNFAGDKKYPIRIRFFDPDTLKIQRCKKLGDVKAFDAAPCSLQLFTDGTGLLNIIQKDHPCIWRAEGHRVRLAAGSDGRLPDSFIPGKGKKVFLLEPARQQ